MPAPLTRLIINTLLIFLPFLPVPTSHAAGTNNPHDIDQFFKSCPPSACGSIPIRFPLRLQTSNPSCGFQGLSLTCSSSSPHNNNDTLLLSLPSLPPFKVTRIDYRRGFLTVHIGSLSSSCSLPTLDFFFNSSYDYFPSSYVPVSLVNCSGKFMDSGYATVAVPIPCLSGSSYFVYAVDAVEPMDVIPDGCVVAKTGGQIPYSQSSSDGFEYLGGTQGSSLKKVLESFEEERELDLSWEVGGSYYCRICEEEGRLCGYDWDENRTICQEPKPKLHGLKVKIITGTSIGGFIVFVTSSLIYFYISRQSKKEKETRLKVERFLATYKTTKPTRYTYSNVKKITKRFRHKLGQGGFGGVYKGELPNGIPVAVKMLEQSKGEADEFINEVATMGRIHHVNVVRLLGFCSEGTRHALIYEFMPNESLEKFIFSKEARRTKSDQPFSTEKLQEIAIGVARGIEYLHQGCDQRILHFDIKPHNILLDHNYNPKISDFGLAKVCSRDQSIVTMTAARGTMGYIAPEVYSRNFGTVSYKSDVYSFGMLLLEMVSGKRNVDPEIENRDDVYFPEWIYDHLVHDDDLGLAKERGKDEDIAKKLVIVALWCIQWSPNDRPTMTRVVQLLMGNLESLQIPPKPFVSSSDGDDDSYVYVVVADSTNRPENSGS